MNTDTGAMVESTDTNSKKTSITFTFKGISPSFIRVTYQHF